MELLPLGPVLFIDTAGIDDVGALGEKRIRKTMAVIDRTDLGIIVSNSQDWGDFEEKILQELRDKDIPVILAFNKTDLYPSANGLLNRLATEKLTVIETSATQNTGIQNLREAILNRITSYNVCYTKLLRRLN